MADKSLEELGAAIDNQMARAIKAREQLEAGEAKLSKQVQRLAKTVQAYNRARLQPLIDVLIKKGLAFYDEALVNESDLMFRCHKGTEKQWRGDEYHAREETVRYKRTYLVHSGSRDAYRGEQVATYKGQTVRDHWVDDFRERFAVTPARKLPGWLTIAVPKKALPKPPIGLQSYHVGKASREIGKTPPAYEQFQLLRLTRNGEQTKLRFQESFDFYKVRSDIGIDY